MSTAITDALERMRADRQWARANPANPVCDGCNRRDEPGSLVHGFCPECRDTLASLKTGCRFGREPCCGSDDCRMPLAPDEEALVALYQENPSRFDWLTQENA
ncbi:hypothetical protein ACPCSE_30080 [Streptomyces cellulosae]